MMSKRNLTYRGGVLHLEGPQIGYEEGDWPKYKKSMWKAKEKSLYANRSNCGELEL